MNKQIITGEEQKEQAYRKVSIGRLAMATTSALSIACFTSAIGYVSYAANLGFGIPILLIGTLMTLARIFDGITDPIISILIDKCDTKFGKIRIFMVLGWGIESISLLCLYNWFAGKGHTILMFSIIYFLYYIGYTCQNMAGQLISPVITNDPKQRPMVGVFQIIYTYVITIIISLYISMVLLPKNENQYTLELLAIVSVITVVLSGIFLILACIGISPVDKRESFVIYSKDGNKSVGWRDLLALLKNNRAFQCFIFSATSEKLASNVAGQAIINTILFGIVVGNMGFGAILNMVTIIPALIFAVVGGKYVGKHGSSKAISYWSLISIIVNVLFIITVLIAGVVPIIKNIPILICFVILSMLQNGLRVVVSTATNSMQADIVDYEAYRSGKYLPGAIAGFYGLIDKLVSSLGAVIATVSVAIIGYTTTVPQPDDPKSMKIVILSCIVVYILPIIGWICSLVAMKKTPITKEFMVQIQKELSDRKNGGKEDVE